MFIDSGLASDFLARLSAATAAVEASLLARANARGQQSQATGSLRQLEIRGRRVFQALNDLVVPILSVDIGNSGLLAEWRSVRRVTLKPGPIDRLGAGGDATRSAGGSAGARSFNAGAATE